MIFPDTFLLDTVSGPALGVPGTEIVVPVKALFALTDSFADCWALFHHLLVFRAEGAAVQTPGQVVPQLGVVVSSARRALGGRSGGAVRGHVRTWRTHVAGEDLSGDPVRVLICGNGVNHQGSTEDTREQEQHRYEELRTETRLLLPQQSKQLQWVPQRLML